MTRCGKARPDLDAESRCGGPFPPAARRRRAAPLGARGRGGQGAQQCGVSWEPPACTDVWGAFYAPLAGEGNQILQINTSKSVEVIRGHSILERTNDVSSQRQCYWAM